MTRLFKTMIGRRQALRLAVGSNAMVLLPGSSLSAAVHESDTSLKHISLEAHDSRIPFPHYWETAIGSDHAAVTLREEWRRNLAEVSKNCGFRSVRFHGLLNDDIGLCPSVGDDGPVLNFLYVDKVIDGLLDLNVRPLVELSFMPSSIASGSKTEFWYRGNTTPPRDMALWSQIIHGLGLHLIERYGIREVNTWRFEVWNEPNMPSWSGTKEEYFDLYAATARALKAASVELKVGGPATAQTAWLPEFIAFCHDNKVPIDFISTHVYDNDSQRQLFDRDRGLSVEQIMPAAIFQAKQRIMASAFPHLPLAITEWASQNPAYICQTIRDCVGLCDTLSYWIFDNTFEEHGPVPAYGTIFFGLLDQGGVPRPSLHAFELLHRLGSVRIDTADDPVIATIRDDGSMAILIWNLMPEGRVTGPTRPFRLSLPSYSNATVTSVDPSHDPAVALWHSMGRPPSPTREQYGRLRQAGKLPNGIERHFNEGELNLAMPANAIALIETKI